MEALAQEVHNLRNDLEQANAEVSAARQEATDAQHRESISAAQSEAALQAAQARIRELQKRWQERSRAITEESKVQATEFQRLEASNASLKSELSQMQVAMAEQELVLSSHVERIETTERQVSRCKERITRTASELALLRRQASLVGKSMTLSMFLLRDVGAYIGDAYRLALQNHTRLSCGHSARVPRLPTTATKSAIRRFAPEVFVASSGDPTLPLSAESILDILLEGGDTRAVDTYPKSANFAPAPSKEQES